MLAATSSCRRRSGVDQRREPRERAAPHHPRQRPRAEQPRLPRHLKSQSLPPPAGGSDAHRLPPGRRALGHLVVTQKNR